MKYHSLLLTIIFNLLFTAISALCFNQNKTTELQDFTGKLITDYKDQKIYPVPYIFAEKVKELIEQGADPNAANKYNHSSAIDFAAEMGNIELAAFLLSKGAKISKPNDPLYFASYFDQTEMVAFLINAGVPVSVHDLEGAKENTKDLIRSLLYSDFNNKLDIHEIARSGKTNALKKALPYFNNTDSLNKTDKYGQTALYIALVRRDYKMANKLLKYGANPLAGKYNTLYLATLAPTFSNKIKENSANLFIKKILNLSTFNINNNPKITNRKFNSMLEICYQKYISACLAIAAIESMPTEITAILLSLMLNNGQEFFHVPIPAITKMIRELELQHS